jgi:signal transduction histidine kinase
LLQRAAETTDRLEKLQSVSDARLARLSASELTYELLVRARSVVSADAVIFCTGHPGRFTVQAADGLVHPQALAVPANVAEFLNQAIEKGRVIGSLPAPPALDGEPFQRHTRSMLAVPLPVATSIHGVLIAGRQEAQPFTSADEEILLVAADRIAMSIDRTNAFIAEHQARQEAEARATEIRILNAELELRVRERTSDLETTNKELESFSYSVSHDLRAPLRSIDGFSHAFEEDYGQNVDEKGRDYLRRIRENVQRMGQLIDSMLQLSRITRAGLIPEPIDLSSMAAAVAAEIAAQSNGRRFIFQIEPELRCMGDPQLLRAALENLLGNAAKFTSREPEARIQFGRSEGAYFVRDNGVGFDMRYVGKLFSAFTRLHGEKEFRGSGIGLATVARIVQRHHGKIWGESKLGHGATFWFTLG